MAKVTLDVTKLVLLNANTERLERIAVEALGEAVYEESTNNIVTQDAIDTGALLNSGYVEYFGKAGRSAAIAAAVSSASSPGQHSGKPNTPLATAIKGEAPTKPGNARVAYAVEYAFFVEMGHGAERGTTRMSTRQSGATAQRISDRKFVTVIQGRPFLTPAAETIAGEAEEICGRVVAREVERIVR